jgi:hypothetical protein
MSATGIHHFWRISSPIALSRSRSVRLCYKNARSVTSGQIAHSGAFGKVSLILLDRNQG